MSSLPSSDSAYSTEGGDDGTTVRVTTRFFSRFRSRVVSIFGEIPGMSRHSSPKRRGPPLSCQITFAVQVPPNNAMQVPIGHPVGGGGALLLRILTPMGTPRRGALRKIRLPNGKALTGRIVEFL